MVPLTVSYVNKEQYGVWLTISSIVAWFNFFDAGLGNGLRNRLAESMAKDDLENARIYVSTTYFILGAIFLSIIGAFLIINPFLNWAAILNVDSLTRSYLGQVVLITFCFFSLNLILKLIHTIFLANQQPAYVRIMNLVTNIISLTVVYILTVTTDGSLMNLALTLSLSPFLVLTIGSIFLYSRGFKHIRPSLKYVRREYSKDLLGLGFQFFLVQITALIIFSTDNIIVTQLFGPEKVASYGVAHKYFQIIMSIFTTISGPLWSAYTEAYTKGEKKWILTTNRTLIRIWAGIVAFSLIMLLFSTQFYAIWVPTIEVPFSLSVFMWIFMVLLSWGNIFVVFINGVGKVRLQIIVATIGAIINIPLSYFFAIVLNLGLAGVIAASIISISFGPILAPIQFRKIINGTAKGIWNK